MDIELLLKRKLESDQEEERVQAVRELAGLISESSMTLLYLAMGDSSWRVRKQAAESFLSFPQAGELAGAIVGLLHDQDNVGLRNTAVDILVRLRQLALPVLLMELESSDHDVRKFVLDILGAIGDPSCVPRMLPALADPDYNVRAAAAENLGKIGAAESVSALLEAMTDADLLLKFTILEALGKIGGALPFAALLNYNDDLLLRKALFDCIGNALLPEGIPLLVAGLNDSMGNVREAALLALASLHEKCPEKVAAGLSGSELAAVSLSSFLHGDHADFVRAALKLLPSVKDRVCAEALLGCLDQEDFQQPAVDILISLGRTAISPLLEKWPTAENRVRCYLAFLAGATGCVEAECLLLPGLKSPDHSLQLACVQALASLGVRSALPVLIELLQDAPPEHLPIIQDALRRLARAFPEETFSELAPLVEGSSPGVRIVAISILASTDCKSIEPILALALKDESSAVRSAAVKAFADCPVAGQFEALSLALTDEDSDVRQVAATALGGGQEPRAIDALSLALHDEDIWVRVAVVQSLGQIGAQRCVVLIKEALGDPVGLVCIAGLRALFAIDPSSAFAPLIAALYHSDEEVVNAALELLTATGRRDWLESMADVLLNHLHWEVRLNFARAILALGAGSIRQTIEDRLLVEGEDIVRQPLQTALGVLKRQED